MFDRFGRRKYLNERERRAFLTAAKREPDAARRAFCLTVFYTGCRISEALGLTVGRIDFSERALVLETLKRRQRGVFRSVPVPDALLATLSKLVRRAQPEELVWTFSRATAYRFVTAHMRNAGITGGMASPKGLRHSFAVACIARTIPLPTIQHWLGHARLETTALYLAVTGKEERNLARKLWRNADL